MKATTKIILPLGLLGLFACEEGDSGRPTYPSWDQTIYEVASAETDLSKFVQLVEKAQLNDAFDGTTSIYTVFAPTNAAFSALPSETLAALEADPAELSRWLRYSAAGGKQYLQIVGTQGNIKTMTSTTIVVRGEAPNLTLSNSRGSDASVVRGDLDASNGVLHVIDAVLEPPPLPEPEPEPLGTVIDVATDAGSFAAVLAAIDGAGLTDTLADGGPFTVFAPTDDAFGAVDLSMADAAVIENILLSHVAAGSIDAEAVVAADSIDMLANTAFAVDASGEPVTIGGAALGADTDLMADNGIVHGMDAVIVPPTIPELVAATADFSTLDSALSSTVAPAFPDTLAGDMPVTVFAPTDAAFTAAGIDPMTVGTSTLAAVLQHHVAMGQFVAADLADGDTIATLNGTLTVGISGETVTLTDGQGNTVNVTATDIRTLSGVVHVIDGVLLP